MWTRKTSLTLLHFVESARHAHDPVLAWRYPLIRPRFRNSVRRLGTASVYLRGCRLTLLSVKCRFKSVVVDIISKTHCKCMNAISVACSSFTTRRKVSFFQSHNGKDVGWRQEKTLGVSVTDFFFKIRCSVHRNINSELNE